VLSLSWRISTSSAHDIIVLLYHKFDDKRSPSTSVSLENFKAQMRFLKEHKYQVIPLKQVVFLLANHKPLPSKAVVITIDDGYKSVSHIFPILKEFGYPFTIFLPTEAIEKNYPDYLTWKEIKQMQRYGADFQDHSYAHHPLGLKPPSMTETEYRNWIRADLQKSRFLFKKRLGYEPDMLAFPYGYYNQILIDEALKLGYKAFLTQDPGAVSEDTPLTLIPREPILGKEWATMKHFREILERVDMPLVRHSPEIGFLKCNPPLEISAILKYPHRYFHDRFYIYITELGWKKAKYDPSLNKVFITDVPSLRQKVNRIAISGIEKHTGKTAVNFWMVILPSLPHK